MMKRRIYTISFLLISIFSAQAQMPAVGTKATELNYKNPEGKELSLIHI